MQRIECINGRSYRVTAPKVRLYEDSILESGKDLALSKEKAHYLCKVLRMRSGDSLVLFNATCGEWRACLVVVSKSRVTVQIENLIRLPRALPHFELIFSPLRKERMSFLIEKAVELGVTVLQPVISQFTNWKFNMEKMHRVIIESLEQCERLDRVDLHPPLGFEQFMKKPGLKVREESFRVCAPVFVGVERGSHLPEPMDLNCQASELERLSLWIGPEGGWSPGERRLLLEHEGMRPLSFGDQVLRAETAALAGIVLLQKYRKMKLEINRKPEVRKKPVSE